MNDRPDTDGLTAVLEIEVSLLLARRANTDWTAGARRAEAVQNIVERCRSVVAQRLDGRVERVVQSDFTRNGLTVHLTIVARRSALEAMLNAGLAPIERSLESSLQRTFGWNDAALSAHLEARTSYEPSRRAFGSGVCDEGADFSGGAARSPVIVTVAPVTSAKLTRQ